MRLKREGTFVYLWLIHVNVWQKPAQFCKSNILQLKKKKKAGPKATIRRVSHCNKIKHFYMFCRTLMQELQGSHL